MKTNDACSDCDCPETCTRTGCVGMSTERERCGAVAESWLYEFARTYTRLDGDRISRLADLLLRERAAARDEALAKLERCVEALESVLPTLSEARTGSSWHVVSHIAEMLAAKILPALAACRKEDK